MNTQSSAPIWDEQVGRLPLQKPVMVKSTATIKDCIQEMQRNNVGCVLILDDDNQLVGLFTERDLMTKYVGTGLSENESIKNVMTKNPQTLPSDTTLGKVVYFMGEKHFRHLPILDSKNNVLGLLSVRVLIYFIAEHLPEAVLNLPPVEKVIPRNVEGG